jgi:hypothetical protein
LQRFPDLIIFKGILESTLVGRGSLSVRNSVFLGAACELRHASHVVVNGGFFGIRHAFLLDPRPRHRIQKPTTAREPNIDPKQISVRRDRPNSINVREVVAIEAYFAGLSILRILEGGHDLRASVAPNSGANRDQSLCIEVLGKADTVIHREPVYPGITRHGDTPILNWPEARRRQPVGRAYCPYSSGSTDNHFFTRLDWFAGATGSFLHRRLIGMAVSLFFNALRPRPIVSNRRHDRDTA